MTQKKFTNSLSDALTLFWADYTGWGRATRSEYWWAYLFYSVFAGIIINVAKSDAIFAIWWICTLIPSFCLGARRLHDTGRSAWNFCWGFLPLIGWIVLIVYLCQPGQTTNNKWGKPRI